MKPILFRGTGVALVTPFTSDGIDEARLRRLVAMQRQAGTDAIIALGTTGEPATQTQAEKDMVIDIVVRAASGRVSVIVGVGSNDTRTSIDQARRAEALGAQGLLAVTPYYNRPNARGLIRHFTALADATGLPIILYNVPSRTGTDMKPDTLAALAKHPNIVGLKEANGSLSQMAEAMALCGGEIAFYSGNDDQTLPILSLGGAGVISVAANIVPEKMRELTHSFFGGDIQRARELQIELAALNRLLFVEPSPQPLKAAMRMMGLDSGRLRLPLSDIEPKNEALLKAELVKLGLILPQH